MTISERVKSTLEVGSTLLVIAAAGALLWTLYQGRGLAQQAATGPQVLAVDGLSIPSQAITKRIGTGTVALIEFADFQCPFCGRFSREIYPSVREEFVNNGKVTFVSFEFPLEGIHPLARKASEAAECAARQGKYWELRELLYQDQTGLTVAALTNSAKNIGLDMGGFEGCLASKASAAVQADIEQGRRLSVRSTPTLFIGRFRKDGSLDLIKRIDGMAPLPELRSAILDVISRS